MTILANPGLGPMTLLPAGSTNGTPLSAPAMTQGIRFYLPATSSVTFTITSLQPTSAPAATLTVSSANGLNWDEYLSAGQQVFIVATTGTPLYRFF